MLGTAMFAPRHILVKAAYLQKRLFAFQVSICFHDLAPIGVCTGILKPSGRGKRGREGNFVIQTRHKRQPFALAVATRPRRALAVLTGVALVAGVFVAAVAVAKPITVTLGNLVLKFDSSITPKALSKKVYTPITFKLGAQISTKDGKHPPAAKTFEGEVDKNGALNPKGLSVCKPGQLEAQTTENAEKACKGAIIGTGFAEAEVEFPEQAPFDAKGPLVVFNGGGTPARTKIYVHVYANVPAPTAFITPVTVTKVNNGKYGMKIDSKIPTVAGGSGSLTRFEISNHRIFTYKGRKQSYFLAKCPSGRLFGRGEVWFTNGDRMNASVWVPCTPKS
jgi:hypothetical protein